MGRVINVFIRRIKNFLHIPINIIKTAKLSLKVIRGLRHSEEVVGIVRMKRILGVLKRNIRLLWRIANNSQHPTQKADVNRNGKVCFVLGNGPSLDADIKDASDIHGFGDTFCVNDFAKTDLYIKIQPKHYVFADPCWWLSTSPENIVLRRNHVYDEILSKTTWPLTIYVPFCGKKIF